MIRNRMGSKATIIVQRNLAKTRVDQKLREKLLKDKLRDALRVYVDVGIYKSDHCVVGRQVLAHKACQLLPEFRRRDVVGSRMKRMGDQRYGFGDACADGQAPTTRRDLWHW